MQIFRELKVMLNHGSFYSQDGPEYVLFFFVVEEQGEQITSIQVLVVTELSEPLFECGECNFTFCPLHHIAPGFKLAHQGGYPQIFGVAPISMPSSLQNQSTHPCTCLLTSH